MKSHVVSQNLAGDYPREGRAPKFQEDGLGRCREKSAEWMVDEFSSLRT